VRACAREHTHTYARARARIKREKGGRRGERIYKFVHAFIITFFMIYYK